MIFRRLLKETVVDQIRFFYTLSKNCIAAFQKLRKKFQVSLIYEASNKLQFNFYSLENTYICMKVFTV